MSRASVPWAVALVALLAGVCLAQTVTYGATVTEIDWGSTTRNPDLAPLDTFCGRDCRLGAGDNACLGTAIATQFSYATVTSGGTTYYLMTNVITRATLPPTVAGLTYGVSSSRGSEGGSAYVVTIPLNGPVGFIASETFFFGNNPFPITIVNGTTAVASLPLYQGSAGYRMYVRIPASTVARDFYLYPVFTSLATLNSNVGAEFNTAVLPGFSTACATDRAPVTLPPTTPPAPTTPAPTTPAPTAPAPTTAAPPPPPPTTAAPTPAPTTPEPTTPAPTTVAPTPAPTTPAPTTAAPTPAPTTVQPTTVAPTTAAPATTLCVPNQQPCTAATCGLFVDNGCGGLVACPRCPVGQCSVSGATFDCNSLTCGTAVVSNGTDGGDRVSVSSLMFSLTAGSSPTLDLNVIYTVNGERKLYDSSIRLATDAYRAAFRRLLNGSSDSIAFLVPIASPELRSAIQLNITLDNVALASATRQSVPLGSADVLVGLCVVRLPGRGAGNNHKDDKDKKKNNNDAPYQCPASVLLASASSSSALNSAAVGQMLTSIDQTLVSSSATHAGAAVALAVALSGLLLV